MMGLIFTLLIGFLQVFASPHFTALRDDLSVPENCRDMKLSFYTLPAEKIYVGRQGALQMGFSMEYPITRSNATILWRYFKSLTHGKEDTSLLQRILKDPDLKRDYEIILQNYEEQDFDFVSEGEILEALAIHSLYQEFPENHYFVSGGYIYHRPGSPLTIGELDLYVGLRDTCEAVVVGEAKLGTGKTLSKAKQQLDRLESFLVEHDCSGFGGVYQIGKK